MSSHILGCWWGATENPNLCPPGWVQQAVSTPAVRRLSALMPTPTAEAGRIVWPPTHWGWQPWSLVRGPTGTGCLPKTSQALSPGQRLRTPSQSPRKQNQPLPDTGQPGERGTGPQIPDPGGLDSGAGTHPRSLPHHQLRAQRESGSQNSVLPSLSPFSL